MKVGAILGLHDLETSRHEIDRWCLRIVDLRQTGHAGFVASRAMQFFVPLICHEATLNRELGRLWSKTNTEKVYITSPFRALVRAPG